MFFNFSSLSLHQFTVDIFLKMGLPLKDAEQAADVLIKADLRGVDSHGVARLSGYVRLWERGRINPKPNIRIIHQSPSTATVDGDAGLGLVVAPWAMQVAIEKADCVGSGWVSVKNSNHFGIAAYHAMMALEQDMIGLSMTNASPLVAPTHSTERMLGTNPICYAFPAGKQSPLIVDMATSAAANGKLEIAQRRGVEVPQGWIQDVQGHETRDPNGLKTGGTLLPLGSDVNHGSHKGYCLGSVVDVLSAVLSGASYGPWVPPFVAFMEPLDDQPGQGLGHFLGAMRVDGFRPAPDFKNHMDNWIERFKSARRVDKDQPIIIPGEPEAEQEQIRLKNGIPIINVVKDDLETLAQKMGVSFPLA